MSARERRSWVIVGGLLGLSAASPFLGCGPGEAVGPRPEVVQLLRDVGPRVVVPQLDAARAALEALDAAVTAWGEAPAEGREVARVAAQEAWLEAMAAWQVVEVLQVGPAASSLRPGGQDLRDEVYSWPTASRCAVDQRTAAAEELTVASLEADLVTLRGLDALEVLLFSPPGENGCLASAEPNASGAWAALGADGVEARRAAYAEVATEALLARVEALRAAWAPDGGDFGAALAAPGEGPPYDSESDALDAVFHALFYLEDTTKDLKLGEVLELVDCGEACEGEPETPLARASHRWIGPNLAGFRLLFTGAEGSGLDDLLVGLGHGDLVDEVLAALDSADEAAAALGVPVDEAGSADGEPGRVLFDAVKRVCELLKGDLATVLALTVPQEAAGDND